MEKINVLAIAPYEGLRDLMVDMAAQWEDIALTVQVGDLSSGARVAEESQDLGYDFIMSRGGTAEMIEKSARVPVIEIALTGYDLLRVIRLAQNYAGKFAVVGFASVTASAHLICDLLQYQLDIITIHSADEVERQLRDLSSQGYSLIVGDMITVTLAKQVGLNGILITSGRESIEAAFMEVRKLYRTGVNRRRQNALLYNLLRHNPVSTVAFHPSGAPAFSSLPDNTPPGLSEALAEHLPELFRRGSLQQVKKVEWARYWIHGQVMEVGEEAYGVFYIRPIRPTVLPDDTGVTVYNWGERPAVSFEVFANENSDGMRRLIEQAEQYSKLSLPILILGEAGTGKEKLAMAIYCNSSLNQSPFIVIDCAAVQEKRWEALLTDDDSLLGENNCTIHFTNCHRLTGQTAARLGSFLEDAAAARRNRLLFSMVSDSESHEDHPFTHFLMNRLSCLTLSIPALRMRREDISSLASVYISEANLVTGKQVIGIEEEGVALLQGFRWDQNLDQFRNIVRQLVALTEHSYITTHHVRMLLENEKSRALVQPNSSINLDQSLDEIEKEIIRTVLHQENMNQTRAAERLGIARSTMWRKLKG